MISKITVVTGGNSCSVITGLSLFEKFLGVILWEKTKGDASNHKKLDSNRWRVSRLDNSNRVESIGNTMIRQNQLASQKSPSFHRFGVYYESLVLKNRKLSPHQLQLLSDNLSNRPRFCCSNSIVNRANWLHHCWR